MKTLVLGVFISTFSINISKAQKPKPRDFGIKSKKALDFFLKGEQLTQWRDRTGAIVAYTNALELEPEFILAHYRLGVNAYVTKDFEQALPHLEKVAKEEDHGFQGLNFFLAEAYFHTEHYSESVRPYMSFLQQGRGKESDLRKAAINLRKAKFAKEAIKDSIAFKPLNLGENVNTPRDEYLPFLTADDNYLLFTARRPEAIGGFNRQLKDYNEDFYYCEKVDGEWQAATNLGTPINSEFNDGAGTITQDGRTIFFTGCNREGGYGSCDIYFSYLDKNGWTEPQNIGPAINTKGWESQPCLSHDGKTLYFASTRKGGEGGRDIWYSRLVNGKWSEAVNLGAPINTEGNESNPFLHADGTSLYLSSDLHPGFGSRDLFVSYLTVEGGWSEPVNLGYPLNTVADESNIFVSSSGKTGFINSDREGGMGRSDIYQFELAERVRPKTATYLRGITRDSITGAPVYARIRLIDVETGDTLRNMMTGRSDGRFLMSLPLEREYAAIVDARAYLFTSKNFYLKGLDHEAFFDLTINLLPLREGASVVLRNIFFESGEFTLKDRSKVELEYLVTYMKRNPSMRIELQGHTDDVGSEQDNLELSQSRAETVRDYLVNNAIAQERIVAKGYGESMPVKANDTEEGRAANRRTEFKILSL